MYKPEQKNARLLTLVIAGFALVAVAAYFGSLAVEKFRWKLEESSMASHRQNST